MAMNIRTILIIALLAVSLLLQAGEPRAQCCYNEMTLSGTYRSAEPEQQQDGTYGVREFRFTPQTWSLSYTRYADRALRLPLFTFEAEGAYTVNEGSQKVKDAFNAAFRFTKKTLTLLTADRDVIRRLGFGDCGLRKDVPQDISDAGCSFFRPVRDSGTEYDLVRQEGNALYLGARPADGDMGSEAKRPAALGPKLAKVGD